MRIAANQKVLLGPPGTGKTTRLLSLVEDLLEQGYRPEDIAFVSFTKKAVEEAIDRASKKFGIPGRRFSLFKTIHAFCFQQLGCTKQSIMGKQNYMELGAILGYDMSGQYGNIDEGMQGLNNAAPGDALLFIDNISRVRGVSLRQAWVDMGSNDIPWDEAVRFHEGYVKYKEQSGLLDFTDLLLQYIEEGRPSDARAVIVDEGQDLSVAQWRVLQRAFHQAELAVIAGDDDQSIYKWSGADLGTFLALEGVSEVLGHSYRLPKTIHAKANRIIKQVSNRFAKEFTPTDRVGYIDYISQLDHLTIRDDETTLILVRNVYLLKQVYEHVRKLGHTYTGRGGHRGVTPAHVSAMRGWEKLRRGEAISYTEAMDCYELLRIGPVLARGGKAKLAASEDIDSGYAFETLRDHYGLITMPPWHQALEGIPMETREYYQSVLRAGRKVSSEPKIMVNTIHGVKGGEADHVVIISDMAKKTFEEYQKDFDSEHRVAFVAVTRARERVTIVLPRSKYAYIY